MAQDQGCVEKNENIAEIKGKINYEALLQQLFQRLRKYL